jgi:hypothetical protein
MLGGIGIGIVTVVAGSTVAFARRAPAVSAALLGFAVVGGFGFYVSADDGPRGVPGDVAVWASCGLGAGGLLGLAFTSPRVSARWLRRAAIWFLVITPFVVAIVAVALLVACPLYVTEGARYCYHEQDVLGGWISAVTMLAAFNMLALAVVFLASARAASSASVES